MESGGPSFGVRRGMPVLDAHGEQLGEVKDARGDRLIAREGWFFPDDHEVPASAIRSVDADGVHLAVTKEAILAGERDPDGGSPTPVLEGVYDPTLASGADMVAETAGLAASLTGDETRRGVAFEADIVEEVATAPVLPPEPDEEPRPAATVHLVD